MSDPVVTKRLLAANAPTALDSALEEEMIQLFRTAFLNAVDGMSQNDVMDFFEKGLRLALDTHEALTQRLAKVLG